MKRVFMIMVCLLSMVLASTGLKAQEISILLRPGWNWIGYPYPETVDLGTAFGDFEPMDGDMIESSFGYSEYISGYGWYGGVNELRPGWGYMYYSNRTESVTIVFSHPSTPVGSVTVTTSEPMLITAISAMGGGEVTTTDGTYIIVKGLCWATHENPTTNDDFYEEAESGVGTFSISMTELNIATTYYVRAYAVTPNGTVYGDQKTFTTRDGIPEVSTDSVQWGVDWATCYCMVTDNGGLDVIRGVCWSTSPNPTVNEYHTTNGSGVGSFTSNMTELTPNTTYYVRAYASTSHVTNYGEELSFTTYSGIPEVVTSPVTDIYGDGATMGCIVANDGGLDFYEYYCEIGVCWSTSPNPTTNDYKDFIDNSGEWGDFYPISNEFTTYRTGLNLSTTYYVRAYALTRFGTSYGNEVSFTTSAPLWSNGVLPGAFSVSANQQVHFSQGNLQYQASTNMWRFGINQWSYVGGTHIWEVFEYGCCGYSRNSGNVFSENGMKCSNNYISSDYSGWIDLFGWGTSGYNHGAVCYQPWSISEYSNDYKAYGQATYNLYDQTGQADWGSNAISNGGNQTNQWRTLTNEEWKYIFNTRTTISGIRYAKAVVFGVNGVILLPDDWSASFYSLNSPNSSGASFSSNMITAAQWDVLEQYGAVFLPQAGFRHRYTYPVYDMDEFSYEEEEYGYDYGMFYWSSSSKNSTNAWHLTVNDSGVFPQDNSRRHNGFAVRLVKDVE